MDHDVFWRGTLTTSSQAHSFMSGSIFWSVSGLSSNAQTRPFLRKVIKISGLCQFYDCLVRRRLANSNSEAHHAAERSNKRVNIV